MWIRKQTQHTLIIILVLVFLLGCSQKTTELASTEWELISLEGKSLIEGTSITLYYVDEHLGGEMGCNHYGGTPDSRKYSATRDGALTLIPPFAVTVQLCTEPEGIMEQETAYIEALMNAANFQIVNNRLEIENEAGETMLIFQSK